MHRNRFSDQTAEDFKGAILRFIKELKRFRFLIILSILLATVGSILSILAPSKLSTLTDEISKGLVINRENLETLTKKVEENLSQNESWSEILSFQMNEQTIKSILASNEYNEEEKSLFTSFVNDAKNIPMEEQLKRLLELPNSILEKMVSSSVYKGVSISKEDKIFFLNAIKRGKMDEIPKNILSVMVEDVTIDGVEIKKEEMLSAIELLSNVETLDGTSIYQAIDSMPTSIQEVLKPNMNMDAIIAIVITLVGFYLVSALFNFIEDFSMTTVANKFARLLRGRISHKINLLPLKYFDKHQAGDTLSRVTNDVDMMSQTMNTSLSTFVSASVLFIGTLIMMFVTNWVMAITAILASLFGFLFMGSILGRSQKYFVQRQKELGNLNSHIEEIYSGLNVVKAYNGMDQANDEFDIRNEKLYDCNRKSVFLSGLMMPMMNFIGNFGYVAVCIVGALLTMNGSISFGVIVAFISYVRLFTSPLSQIAQAVNQLQSTAAASERVFEFLDEEEMDSEENVKEYLPKEKVKGNIRFEHVVFQYDGTEKPTIHDFNVNVHAGEKIAIVGPTGAGKTTMVNLLMKFYNIKDGDIFIDGISTKNLTRKNIHELFTMVLQDTWIFEGTVKENIKYNRTDISDKKIEEICKTVGLDHFIKTLPNSYDSKLTDNESVSSGQRQLLTIARGMVEDAPFLILDEATSNVDTRTEELVQKAMDTLMEGRTSFIIAHRLSTIKNADLILVMNEGNIIEQGTHEELMKKKGFYADLYNSQFEL